MDAAPMVRHSLHHQQTGQVESQCPTCHALLNLACCPTHGYIPYTKWRQAWISEPCPFAHLHGSHF